MVSYLVGQSDQCCRNPAGVRNLDRSSGRTLLGEEVHFLALPSNQGLGGLQIAAMLIHLNIHIDCMALARVSIAPVLVEAMEVDVEDNACRLMSLFEVVEVVLRTCVRDSTYLEVDGSCSDIAPGDRNMLVPTEECCCMSSAPEEQEDQRWQVELERASWVRSTRMQSCRTSGSFRSEWRIPRSLESQPGATMYLRSMPVAAGAKEVKATYHSCTADAARRDGCNMVRLMVPGFALAISTGDPAFRFERSSPEWTIK